MAKNAPKIAPDATTPDATTPDATTPDATTPDATTPEEKPMRTVAVEPRLLRRIGDTSGNVHIYTDFLFSRGDMEIV